jgi:glyoxylase-like metal-dependent hydrolase (beta-lactamase superfamily II)
MTEFRKEQITEHIYRIYGAGDACMYFIQGSEDALLIDTAYGLGDLKSYIDGIAKTPYRVVITHGHADHANGIGQFSEVYMNRRDIELYYSRSDIQIRRRLLKRPYLILISIQTVHLFQGLKEPSSTLKRGCGLILVTALLKYMQHRVIQKA